MYGELYDLCDILKKNVREVVAKGDINPSELESMYKAVDIIKDIKTIEAMEDAGYSNTYPYMGDAEYRHSMMRGNSYENSYRRGRDSIGRYTSRDNGMDYSRDDDKESVMRQIEMLKAKVNQM